MSARMGTWIVFDGVEGSGKTTQIAKLAAVLQRKMIPHGRSVVTFREPGTTRIGELIRSILLNPDHEEMSGRTETLLFTAARAQFFIETIMPNLNRNDIVLCDRYVSSTVAYQTGPGGTSEEILRLTDYAIGGHLDGIADTRCPDATIILDIPPDVSIARVQRAKDRIEQRPIEFHNMVRDRFRSLQTGAAFGQVRVLDAAGTEDEVHGRVLAALEDLKIW
jgi:dTMP kinase